MSPSRITATTPFSPESDYQPGVGQIRNGLRHLLKSISDGSLEDAQQAYHHLSQTMPVVFDRVSLKLTHDYGAIGHALGKGDISRAQKAAVQLGQDLQNIGRTENIDHGNSNRAGIRNSTGSLNDIIRSYYSGNSGESAIGAHIDIIV
jgi:hypothetical protein